ncbi:MAG: hypothetical protein WD824_24990 [Cyclobacteriaceae bacterium]
MDEKEDKQLHRASQNVAKASAWGARRKVELKKAKAKEELFLNSLGVRLKVQKP